MLEWLMKQRFYVNFMYSSVFQFVTVVSYHVWSKVVIMMNVVKCAEILANNGTNNNVHQESVTQKQILNR